jgi:hypothetical protein
MEASLDGEASSLSLPVEKEYEVRSSTPHKGERTNGDAVKTALSWRPIRSVPYARPRSASISGRG